MRFEYEDNLIRSLYCLNGKYINALLQLISRPHSILFTCANLVGIKSGNPKLPAKLSSFLQMM